MSKSNYRKRLFNFGRVFFPGDKSKIIPDEIRFQPLGNHVGNVKRLAKLWDLEDEESRSRIIRGIELHDMAKPQTFKLLANTNKKGKFQKYIYSFSGHRFSAKDIKYRKLAEENNSEYQQSWVETLAIGHHKYSVRELTEDIYHLKKNPEYENILEKEPLAYAKELYILEMCDQIEAELACYVCGDEQHGDERTFMEYSLKQDEGNRNKEINIYYLDPYPFEEPEIKLKFNYWSWCLSNLLEKEKNNLHKLYNDEKYQALGKKLDSLIKKWWKDLDVNPKISTKQAIIKPYPSQQENIDIQNKDCKYWYRKLTEPIDDKTSSEKIFIPNSMQEEVFNKITNEEHPACIVKAPTGKGKLEAILFPALVKNLRLISPLPAKSLLQDHQQRIEKYLKRFSQLYPQREFSLVIDTGSEMKRYVYINGNKEKSRVSNPRRHLYKGDIILTTLDKFLYRYFSFGEPNKNFVFSLRINGKIDNRETLICFDEAHSYENLAFTNFKSLIDSLYEVGRSLVLMTATMPKEIVEQFDYLADDIIDYVDNPENAAKLNLSQHHRSFKWISDITRDQENPKEFQTNFTKIILEQWQAKPNIKIIAVVETVQDAAAIYQNVKEQLNLDTKIEDNYLFLYHGRIAEQLRPEIYQKLKERDSQNKKYILITTSAIEVGCDLNSETLISQICPPENLIQRVGRCNRNGKVKDAKVIVVGDRISAYINTLDELGWDKYQQALKKLTTFETDRILDCIYRQQHIDDYRAVELFSMLHDYVYSADLTCEPIHRKGLIPTRSWTPSVTLVYDDGTCGENLNKMPKITVGIDRLIIKSDKSNLYAGIDVYERYYDIETYQWKTKDLSWGLAYQKNILVKINNSESGAFFGEENKKEYPYNRELGFVDLPGVFIAISSKETENRLLYQTGEHKAIIHYVKPLTDSKN
ncbi:putative ATP-dependent RNA helicase [Hyella patelloides LEGE 07179]|uniref:Putative ATP-dependent RNA helicase n=1 Tax=Hyella patelloides LEGE 07179 TaxID=945734 RepID=A0A563VRG5_9CYAN|nr:CRISPR-associated helicase Cas3' [Hyella patelloides]VEP14001.1 putative ATP-dependent RNA helicase [Hyella patelloides LEGE 07179]